MSTTSTTTSPTQTGAITADNVLRLFGNSIETSTAARQGNELEGYDAEQIRLMDEMCIVLDQDDQPIGRASKKTCEDSSIQDHDMRGC